MDENPKKVSYNNASEASYVYILSVQKLIKNAQIVQFGEFFFENMFYETFWVILIHCVLLWQFV